MTVLHQLPRRQPVQERGERRPRHDGTTARPRWLTPYVGSTPFASTGTDPAGYGGSVGGQQRLASRKSGPATFAYANPPPRLRAAPH
ncbi:MAG: hypothetical protein AAB490_05285, partial [Patescibacteria group bacterium]